MFKCNDLQLTPPPLQEQHRIRSKQKKWSGFLLASWWPVRRLYYSFSASAQLEVGFAIVYPLHEEENYIKSDFDVQLH